MATFSKLGMAIAAALLGAVLAGCLSFSATTSGAATVHDLQAENDYFAAYASQGTQLAADLAAFQPSGNNPGPCNIGGDKEACIQADNRAITTLTAVVKALQAADVPPRFVEGDRLLRDAFVLLIQGMETRNEALANSDSDAWTRHQTLLADAQAKLESAYSAFPADHKPPMHP
jgi:hypothetical protein